MERKDVSVCIENKGMKDANGINVPSYRVVHASNPQKNIELKYPNNKISNTKYTFISFIPLNLKEQFALHMNKYFLGIACLQLIPQITPVSPLSTWLPLIVIFAISAIRELLDDKARAKEDKLANERKFTLFRDGNPIEIESQDISVGDIIRLNEDDSVPCDLVLLRSSSKDGSCMIQTTNLDGETNLKQRIAIMQTKTLSIEEIIKFNGVVECSQPDANLYSFDARIWIDASNDLGPPQTCSYSLSSNQLLQQATTLRNTEWVIGLAVYTGNETKFGKNKGALPRKITKVDLLIDRISVFVFCFQLGLVVLLGAYGETKRIEGREWWYLDFPNTDIWYEHLFIPLRFLLLNSTMIPISLKVTLDLCKWFYAYFVNNDLELYDDDTNTKVNTSNTSVCEDLGQIEYILSDKTGTLTQNNMVFKQCTIDEIIYLEQQCTRDGDLNTAVRNEKEMELEIMRNIALNNTVVPILKGSFQIYKAQSPDEATLVETAAQFGVKLLNREGDLVEISVNGRLEKYIIRQECPFSSDRRRMSVIVENCETHQLRMYIKGADEMLVTRLHPSQNAKVTISHLNTFAMQGLRTLMFAYRNVGSQEFEQWTEVMNKANNEIANRQAAQELAYDVLERNLIIQGGTAIEDKLQQEVNETIEVLRSARIKFWMLTGDKKSTALQVATACFLKSPEAKVYEITGSTEEEVIRSIDELQNLRVITFNRPIDERRKRPQFNQTMNVIQQQQQQQNLRQQQMALNFRGQQQPQVAIPISTPYYDDETIVDRSERFEMETTIVMNGKALELALQHRKDAFSRIALCADTVICCRVAPAQKAQLVSLVRNAGKMTLAIGDGGNDVAMIQAAHVGVGIRGKEGLQASRAADYAVPWFRALKRLILVHGHYAYTRTALVAQYSFYKSFFFCFIQIFYSLQSYYSGTSLFNSLCVTAYNAALFFPIVTIVLDKDVPIHAALNQSQIYRQGVSSYHFNVRTFVQWMFRALFQAIVVFVISIFTRSQQWHAENLGYGSDYEGLGIVAFMAFLWIQSITLTLEMNNITMINIAVIWGFHLLAIILLVATNLWFSFREYNPYYSISRTYREKTFWLSNLLTVAIAVLPIIAIQSYLVNYAPSLADKLRRQAKRMEERDSSYHNSSKFTNQSYSSVDDEKVPNNNVISPSTRSKVGTSL